MAPASEDVDMEEVGQDTNDTDETEQRIINEEYKQWKKNTPFLYDSLLTCALEWATLTTQWFPDVKDVPTNNFRLHRLLIGTHTSGGAPNYLHIAHVELPKSYSPRPDNYDEERGEIGGYGISSSGDPPASIKMKIEQKIDHPGEVNKARYQPQNPNIIATMCNDGRVLIFDRTKQTLKPTGTVSPQAILQGHTVEGYGLCWNPHEAGKLATGAGDNTMRLWDLNTIKSSTTPIVPSATYKHHSSAVNDVQYHPLHKSLIGSVSDDMTVQIVDLRRSDKTKSNIEGRHDDAINTLAFNPASDYILATASADKTIGIWDLRSMKERLHTLIGHGAAVTSLSWSPFEEAILGSGSHDRRVILWDLSKVGEEQLPDDTEDGAPEILFMHGGHTNHLSEFSWNPNDPWVVASAADDNVLQIWRVAEAIVDKDDAGIPLDEVER